MSTRAPTYPGIKISGVILARARYVKCHHDVLHYQLRTLAVKNARWALVCWRAFLLFSLLCPAFSFADVDTYECNNLQLTLRPVFWCPQRTWF